MLSEIDAEERDALQVIDRSAVCGVVDWRLGLERYDKDRVQVQGAQFPSGRAVVQQEQMRTERMR